MSYDLPRFDRALREAALAAAALARYCDHVEHAEVADVHVVTDAAARLRAVALDLSAELRVDLFELYALRLDAGERRFVLGIVDGFEGGAQVRLATSWRDLQLIQGQHDRLYRPDVNGLSRFEQLRHVCLHVTKAVGAIAVLDDDEEDFCSRTLPDLLLLGIKLSTIVGEILPEARLPRDVLDGAAESAARGVANDARPNTF